MLLPHFTHMPPLTAAELQEARVASGRLGGRPRKPTVSEAREAALAELVPPSIVTLKAHIESGAPDAWKAGIRVLELAFARTDASDEFRLPSDPAEIEAMSWKQMTFLAASLTAPSVDEENAVVAVVEANGIGNGTSSAPTGDVHRSLHSTAGRDTT